MFLCFRLIAVEFARSPIRFLDRKPFDMGIAGDEPHHHLSVLLLQPSSLLLLPSTSTTELKLGEAANDCAGSPPHLRSGGLWASSLEGGSGTGDKGGALQRDPQNPSSGHCLGSPIDVAPSSDEHLQRFSATVRILSTKPSHLRSPH
jgi:hypothetical protein